MAPTRWNSFPHLRTHGFLLDAYDKDTLRTKGVTKKDVTLTADMLEKEIAGFKDSLIKRGEATELFGQEKQSERSMGSLAT